MNENNDIMESILNSYPDPRKDLADELRTISMNQIGRPPEYFLGMRTGWPKLDIIIKGFHPECFYVCGGRPGSGKTSFATTVTGNMMKLRQHKVVFISTELNLLKVHKQVCEAHAGGTPFAPNGRTLNANEQETLGESVRDISDCIADGLLHIVHAKSISITDIKMAMAEAMGDEGPYSEPPLVIIDQASRVKRASDENSYHMKTEDMINELEALAGDSRVPLMLMTQLHRGTEAQKRPTMSNFKHSGAFEEMAHCCILLEKEEHDLGIIYIDKNRDGDKRTLPAHFYGESHTWDID